MAMPADPIQMLEEEMDIDIHLLRKGVVQKNRNIKGKNKGPRPTDQDQKQWAPLLYFVHSVAGTVISMMHKLGMFKLRISYGIKMVSDYLYTFGICSCMCVHEDAVTSSSFFNVL